MQNHANLKIDSSYLKNKHGMMEDRFVNPSTTNKISYCLTRYLYLKVAVIRSLIISLDLRDTDAAIYWAYELYNSGFQHEVMNYLLHYLNYFYDSYPKFKRSIKNRYEKWKLDYKTHYTFLASFVKNLCIRDQNRTQKEPKTILIVQVKEEKIEYLNTKKINNPSHYLEEVILYYAIPVCLGYEEITDFNNEDDAIDFIRSPNWLYHASHSPIWRARIHKHNGKIIDEEKKVVFENEEDFEKFHSKFGFDIDEQPLNILMALVGHSKQK